MQDPCHGNWKRKSNSRAELEACLRCFEIGCQPNAVFRIRNCLWIHRDAAIGIPMVEPETRVQDDFVDFNFVLQIGRDFARCLGVSIIASRI